MQAPGRNEKRIVEGNQFSYRITKDYKVFIYWHGKRVKTSKGNTAQKFVSEVECADDSQAQLTMARITGNFKRGNERSGRQA